MYKIEKLSISSSSKLITVAIATIFLLSIAFTPTLASGDNGSVEYPVPNWNVHQQIDTLPSPWYTSGNMLAWYNVSGCSYNPTSKAPESSHLLWVTPMSMGGVQLSPDEADPNGNYGFSNTSTFSSQSGVYAVSLGGRYVTASGAQVVCYDEFTGKVIWQTTLNASMGGNLAIRSANPPQVLVCSTNGMVTAVSLETGQVVLQYKFPYEVVSLYEGDAICRSSSANAKATNRTTWIYRYTFEATPKLKWGPVQGSYRMIVINEGVIVTHLPTEKFLNGVNASTGKTIWTREVSNMNVGAAGYGKYFVGGVDQAFYAYDVKTGALVWRTDVPGASFWSENYNSIGGGYVVCGNYDGKFHVFNATSGEQVWEYYTGNCPWPGYKEWYGTWMVSGGSAPVGADGKVYAATGEHSNYEVAQLPGHFLYGLSLKTGDLLWKYPIRLGGHNGRPIIADGMLFTADGLTNQLHCFGKGPTSMELSLTATQIAKGEFTAITGKITDQSPGQPGTPAVSKESMDAWMAYLHGGFAKPAAGTIKGVPVSFKAIALDGEVTELGTVVSDSMGYFAYKWTPPAKDEVYTIVATFEGDESYFGTQSETHLTFDQPASAASLTGSNSENMPATAPLGADKLNAESINAISATTDVTVAILAAIVIAVCIINATAFIKIRKTKGGN
jgi:outer membrane protein assembly factor BamB